MQSNAMLTDSIEYFVGQAIPFLDENTDRDSKREAI